MTTLEGIRRQNLVFWRDILQEEVQITSKKSLFETSVLTNYWKVNYTATRNPAPANWFCNINAGIVSTSSLV